MTSPEEGRAASAGPASGAGSGAFPTREEMAARLADARERLAPVAHRTPVVTSRTIDGLVGAQVFLKCENFQRMGAFKFRGAYNTISRLAPEALRRGVIAYSSGNHAQAVALVARMLEAPAVIVMPSFAPRPKLEATRGYGAEVVFHDRLGENREALARRLAAERGLTLIPPFDHPDIIAGAGTAALELFEDRGAMDLLVVPVGGGGLISGSALAADVACGARCRVVGVEPEAGDDGCRSFREGRIVTIPPPDTIADGARTPSLGPLTFEMIRRHVNDMTCVPDPALIEAMRLVWERAKLVVEPTGVLGLAALLTGRVRPRDHEKRVGVILSGGNVDLARAGEWFGGDGAR
ncbi:MAG TPA: threo-3-hydroxy-L-aspartate ammonia-lyase [Terriglobales bacterium]|nr:threo-3-hydroxy-L-aspartate ammonia-lyase [Terriglobales bacterium]